MSLPLWEECGWVSIPSPVAAEEAASLSDEVIGNKAFNIDESINRKVHLYLGSGYKVSGDAIVVGQNEQLTDRSEDIGPIFALGGPTFEEEVQLAAPIQTGDSCITSGGNLPFEYVIHSVSPRYDDRYLTASEHALYAAYKSAILLAIEKGVQDLVLTCIYSKRKHYPRDEAAHIALRVVRKFLQHTALTEKLRRVMFCVPTQEDYEIYAALMIAYFPRSAVELQYQEGLLPPELGDEWGEIKQTERVLKVSAGPKPLTEDELAEYRTSVATTGTTSTASSNLPRESFSMPPARRLSHTTSVSGPPMPGEEADGANVKSMQVLDGDDNRDEERRAQVAKALQNMSRQQKMELRFQSLADDLVQEEAEVAELGDENAMEAYRRAWKGVEDLELVEFIGKDKFDRTVVLVCADRLRFPKKKTPPQNQTQSRAPLATNEDDPYDYFANSGQAALSKAFDVDLERITLYFLKVFENLACRPFVLVYAYSNVTDESKEPDQQIAEVLFDLLDARYRMNLQKFYILHASFFFRMSAWATMPFASLSIWKDLRWAKRMQDMTKYIDLERQNWPTSIVKHDESLDT